MEEDIKILEEFIDGLKQYNPKTGKNIEPICFGGGQRYVYKNVYYAIHHLIKAYRENEAIIKEKDKTMRIQKQKLHELKFDLKTIKKDLDFEPWSTYKVEGNKLFDMATILKN
ncbi:MAG: hypothetical protein J6K45_04965 [Clostridia bacterium]|nr:hypothetical protein [Clostridia bacterium]